MEGQTEIGFVRAVVAPYLALKGVSLWARLPGHERRRGGVRPWESICGDIVRTLKERRDRYCTTMFDYYAMPRDWPGREDSSRLSWDKRGECVEKALAEDIAGRMSADSRPERFVPYVQVHEFEAVLFSDVQALNEVLSGISGSQPGLLTERLKRIVDDAGAPEAIDDCPETAPSKRLLSLAAGYKKRAHGIIAAKYIGLPVMRAACPHFDRWVTRLEALGA